MTARKVLRPVAAVLLCVAGFALAWPPGTHYRKTTVIVDAGGCRLVTDVLDRGEDSTLGSVLLFPGFAANKKIMAYIAQGFALQNLRVFVPDLPGHARTPGPFSFARAAACADAFTRQLIARGVIDGEHTVVAGHSMGGAIAVIVGSRSPVAGVIAISPAPMTRARGIPAFMRPFNEVPATPANTLAISGSAEPGQIRGTAQDLAASAPRGTGKFVLVPRSTHVSVLFDSRVVRAAQQWTERVLHAPPGTGVPSIGPVVGWLVGFVGLLVLSGPFIRETVGPLLAPTPGQPPEAARPAAPDAAAQPFEPAPVVRALLEVAAISIAAVVALHFWNPWRFVHIFQGDYLCGFLVYLGTALLVLRRTQVASALRLAPITVATSIGAALMLHFLTMGWFELTITETWLTPARWLRFPAVFLAVLPYHLAEEILLGSPARNSATKRLFSAVAVRLVAWVALLGGVFVLHSGEIFLVLLAVYFGLFCLLQRLGMQVVRKSTGSPLAAALFGAILVAGFALVVFPIN